MKEQIKNYFNVLGPIFLIEGISQALFYPIGPLLLIDHEQMSKMQTQYNSTADEHLTYHNNDELNVMKGQLCM